jgi:type IV secretion system protein TrbJ
MSLSRFRRAVLSGIALATVAMAVTPASAIIVFDPSNYAQNILTAARTLEQINNQIRQLQNQATSLINEAKNLTSLPLTVLEPLRAQIAQTQTLLRQAQRMAYDVQQIETQFGTQYKNIDLSASDRALVDGAEGRWKTSVAAFEDALKVQAGAVANIDGARGAVTSLVTASQSATGALQAAQAGNQLLALQSQQLADLTAVVAAQGRAQALDAAGSATAKAQAREQLRRFLTPGRGYVAGSVSMFHR